MWNENSEFRPSVTVTGLLPEREKDSGAGLEPQTQVRVDESFQF